MKGICLLSLTLMTVLRVSHADTLPSHLREEGHRIIKRFASEQEFEGHDIAHVLHEKQPNSLHHINRRDLSSVVNSHDQSDFTNLRLDLSNSGESLGLRLKRSPIVDHLTEFVSYRKDGRVKRSASVKADCLATGHAEGSPNEIASVSVCDGLHGIVNTKGYDYYVHPVESETADEGHRVHILWKRSTQDEGPIDPEIEIDDEIESARDKRNADAIQSESWKNENATIEMAMFTDARAWQRLQMLAPGREDEYLLVSMAAANALYSDKDKVGYNMFIKVRLVEHWEVDPEEYVFNQSLIINLRSFCQYTREKYNNPKYDMHFLRNGVTSGVAVGRAYLSGVCRSLRCGNTYSLGPNNYGLIAHEIGHNLGFGHHSTSKCPDEIKTISGGFMGGGRDFSPCNRWELQRLFKSGKGDCLFDTKGVEANLKRVFPGQSRSPDKLCELYAGFDYKYFNPNDLSDYGACRWFNCLNTNKTSPGYQSIKQMVAPAGFPCGEERFCQYDCHPWTGYQSIGWDVDYLRSFKQNFEWSSWPQEWSECSSTCGNGVQIKERECLIEDGVFVSPYCKGSDNIKARLCAQTPCDDEPRWSKKLRKTRADRMCASFYENDVQLQNPSYLPRSNDGIMNTRPISTSCFLYCQRDKGVRTDGILKDGTPCLGLTRYSYDHLRFRINMKCAKGRCLEFSNCPDNEPKDNCGVCTNADGYDGSRCITETISDDLVGLSKGERYVLATFPAGSLGISVHAHSMRDSRLELWTGDGSKLIWGDQGRYRDWMYRMYISKPIFAGTGWFLHFKEYVRAHGRTNESVMLKFLAGTYSKSRIVISYLLPK